MAGIAGDIRLDPDQLNEAIADWIRKHVAPQAKDVWVGHVRAVTDEGRSAGVVAAVVVTP